MPWIYALELLALIGVAWLIAARLGAIAQEMRRHSYPRGTMDKSNLMARLQDAADSLSKANELREINEPEARSLELRARVLISDLIKDIQAGST